MESHILRAQLHRVNEVNKTLMQCQTEDDVVEKALEEVFHNLNVQVASMFFFSDEGVIRRIQINGLDSNNRKISNDWFADEKYKPGESFSGKAVPSVGLSR